MTLYDELNQRLHKRDIERFARLAEMPQIKEQLLELALGADDRVAYNALWVLSHFKAAGCRWLTLNRDTLIDKLLTSTHAGHKRLLLHIIEKIHCTRENVRTDFLDFCLDGINSTEPYAIRAFCLRLAYAQCRHYPELMDELVLKIELMRHGELSPGLRCARKNVLRQIAGNNLNARKQP